MKVSTAKCPSNIQEEIPVSQQQVPEQPDSFWSQIKISNKNIPRRSYHSAIACDSYLYVYGGYDINTGIMSDFYKIDLKDTTPKWVGLPTQGKNCPGPRFCHSAVLDGKKIYIFGGKTDSLNNTNTLHIYDVQSGMWLDSPKYSENQIPAMDSHSAVIRKEKMLVFGGFIGGKMGKYSNSVYSLDLVTLKWAELQISGTVAPTARANSSMALLKDNDLYLFGGSNLDQKFRDLWKLNLQTLTWEEIAPKQQEHLPDSRDGHSLVAFNDSKLLVFGGIHDITHEKNDIYIFETDTQAWRLVEDESQKEVPADTHSKENQENTHTSTVHHNHHKKAEADRHQNGEKSHRKYRQLKENNYYASSPGQVYTQKEQKSKQDVKKLQLLSEFELTNEQKETYRNPSPTLESLKSSIKAINGSSFNANKKKQAIENNSQSVNTTFSGSNTAWPANMLCKKNAKKKPCARDGHSANMVEGNRIVIFGGDRHMMSFNDLFLLELDKFPK